MKRTLVSAALAASSLAFLACDLEQLTADHVMVGTLLSTPEVEVSASALAGYDAGTFSPDGGDVLALPAQTAAVVFFGSKTGENSQPSGRRGPTSRCSRWVARPRRSRTRAPATTAAPAWAPPTSPTSLAPPTSSSRTGVARATWARWTTRR
ncbi:hypothetical protein QEG98_14450 [Myxococcus sp. MxC21-1]|uniref:hypothetical protein n=1 Tax=Myxococcus sp. MxC21-1 TaxID=3041439 RepID=UPI002931AF69|nr:hypothetical protein [Myxococcus sp. MxC21-1]WNZ64758.1 hypothetical protein QEG98_14450 [Myxococcus sp. MxC21-1]